MTLNLPALRQAVLLEVALQNGSRDEADLPPEFVELTGVEIAELQQLMRGGVAVARAKAGTARFCGLLIREVDEAGPTRVKSRAEVMLESQSAARKSSPWNSWRT